MRVNPVLRQNLTVLLLIIATGFATERLYRWMRPEWVVYREAENSYLAKDWKRAAKLYEESFQMGLKYPFALLNLAHTYMAMNQFSKAKDPYEAYLKVKPSDIFALKDYAAVLTATGEFKEAEQIYQKILLLESSHKETMKGEKEK